MNMDIENLIKIIIRENRRLAISLLVLGLVAGVVAVSGCIDQDARAGLQNTGLTILVDDPDLVSDVQELAELYRNETGKEVTVTSLSWEKGGTGSLKGGDLLISDMTRIPVYAQGGQLKSLNPFLDGGIYLNWTLFERPPLVTVGEWPPHSGTFYALPFSSDALGVLYRADLFSDPEAATAFCSTRGYEIGVPGTYEELNALASFFHSQQDGLSGIVYAGLNGPDPQSSPWLSLVSSYGSAVIDNQELQASGRWNSSRTIHGLRMLQNLSQYEPAGADRWGDEEVVEEFGSGKAAIAITWFSRFPEMISHAEENNLTVGFFPLPGEIVDGESYRGITVRIDGISMIDNGSTDAALGFLTWFYSPRSQLEWAQAGHQPSLIPVLDSYEYLSMSLYNRGVPESLRVGVTEGKGVHTEEIRIICEETVREVIRSPVNETAKEILDASACRIDQVSKT